MIFKKEKDPVVQFVTTVPGLGNIDGIRPEKANKFIPEWWRNTPYYIDKKTELYTPTSGIVRGCPAFPDLFSSGYIVPMWADTMIYFNSKTGEWRWQCGTQDSPFKIRYMEQHEYAKYGYNSFGGSKIISTFQFVNPWRVKTPKGYSVFQFPVFYHYSSDYSVLPGTYDGFTVNGDKLEVAIFSDDKEILIKKGTPLIHYIPYKKISLDHIVRDFDKDDEQEQYIKWLNNSVIFKNWYGQNRNRGSQI